MSKYFTPMNQKPSLLQNFNNLVNSPMQSQEVISKMPRKDKQHLQNVIHDEKLAASEDAEMKQYATDMAAKGKAEAARAAQESLRSAQGEFESSLDTMIKPSMEGGIGGALNTGALHVQSFFGDKMANHALQKMAAKKALEKGGEQVLKKGVEKSLEKGAGGIGTGAVVNMGLQAAGVDVGGMAKEALGGGDAGGALGGALSAGLSSGFNPVAMGVGAVMGIMSSAEERRAQKREGQAQALEAKSGGESNKARIKGRLAESMSKTLLSGMNRKVNL
tara:strand:+ start:7413 stop:8240 length:828 start_codon:yes stop_codon:yes gene_type:complete